MTRAAVLLNVFLVACAGADSSPPDSLDPAGGDSLPDDSVPDDSLSDTAPDSAPPCEAGLTASIDGVSVAALSFGEAPARGDALTLSLTLHNGCDERGLLGGERAAPGALAEVQQEAPGAVGLGLVRAALGARL